MKKRLAKTKLAFEDKLVRIALVGSAFPLFISIGFIAQSGVSGYLKTLLIFVVIVSIGFAAFAIRQQVIFQLRTSTNLVEAMTSGDYSLRANNKNIEGALSDFNELLNKLATRLAQQSLITREKQILLTKITDQIDVAVIACDQNENISLMNPAAQSLFKRRFSELEGWPIKTLGLQNIIQKAKETNGKGSALKTVTEFEINQDKRKVYVHTDAYFELGQRHQLVFITDIQDLLRDEERLAWQRLLRVLSHEINNSLTPIASISETLTHIVSTQNTNFDEESLNNLKEGLAVITERAHSLNHFIQDYQKLARLPSPNKSIIELRAFISSILQLFETSEFSIPDNENTIFGDSEQLQQALVNVIKNAQEANLANPKNKGHSPIVIAWRTQNNNTSISIEDCGLGVNNSDNVFVPYYTTKKQGSGIGLTLSRQIALNHGGDLLLNNVLQTNKENVAENDKQSSIKGAKATLILPHSNG
jgi:nitrogen fixation/metabolism regulation signal transduction histidine kinase